MRKKSKIISLLLTIIIIGSFLVGCKDKAVVMKDREGNEFTLPTKVERIISTAPSNTEILLDLGLGDKLIGIDEYSVDVEGVNEELPKINFTEPDAEAIIAMNPDIIIASNTNRGGGADPFKSLKDAGITVVYVPSSTSINEICEDINFIAEVTNKKEEGKKIVDSMKEEVEKIKAIGETITDKKKVYFEIGSTPNLASFGKGTFLNEMIEIIGAENIFASEDSWLSISEEAVVSANPDVILTNEGYLGDPTKYIAERAGWEGVTAIKDNAI